MSLRNVAGLLAGFGLVAGLIGSGVGAVFTDQVTAQENINVGTFACQIVAATPGADIAPDGKSVSYTAPTIMSSAPGSAPFSFTVENVGTIPQDLTVSTSGVSGPFSIIGAPFAPVALAGGDTHAYSTGVQWTELSTPGVSGTATWTVSCGELPAPVTIQSAQLNFSSTGAGGWSCPTGDTIVSASVDTAPTMGGTVLSNTLTLWKPGASVPGYTYPNTPFGYTYGPGEEGAIVQNGAIGQSLYIILVCQPL
jgi:hypothetical protein